MSAPLTQRSLLFGNVIMSAPLTQRSLLFVNVIISASHARTLLPAALASVPFGFVLVRVRVRESTGKWELRAGVSYELCIVRTVRAQKGARWVGVLEYWAPL